MKLVCKKDFTLGNKYYEKGDEIIVASKEQLILLNEKGFIEPLTRKEIENYNVGKDKINKEEL